MTRPNTDSGFDLYMVSKLFGVETCVEFVNELSRCTQSPATVYGGSDSGSVDERVRKASRLAPSPEIVERVRLRLLEYRGKVGEHFGTRLSDCEESIYLRR